jgi:hypothetical protein
MSAGKRAVLLLGLCLGLTAYAADPPADLKGKQTQNAEQFRLLKDGLLKLAQKLAVSDKPAERERAKVILAALDLAARENIDGQFRALAGALGKDGRTVQDLEAAIGQDGQLLKALQDMLALLLTDDEAERQKAEVKRLTEILKEVRDIKRAQETLRALTDAAQKADAAKQAKTQADLADRTKALEERMSGNKKSAGDPKKGDPKAGKDGQPKDGKDDKGKNGESKDGKDKDGKDGDPKGKEGQPKDAKDGGQPKDGKQGQPKDGKAGEPKDGQPKQGQPSQQQQDGQQQLPTPGQQRVKQAVPQQRAAADDLNEQKRPDAGNKQDKALDELAKAERELEKRLKQLREEELMRRLAGLEARCNRMIQLQTAVYEATKAIDGSVQKAGGQKSTADIQKAQTESDREREIVAEADKGLDLLKAEGSAVAFAGVLVEVREDMLGVQRRLGGADVGAVTQEVEANIIALLKEMAAALKKQQQDMQQQQQQQQQQAGQPPPNQDLVNRIAELKLIRSLQSQVNARTKLYGAKSPGEQAADPKLAEDLRVLAARQVKIQEMIAALATGANQ